MTTGGKVLGILGAGAVLVLGITAPMPATPLTSTPEQIIVPKTTETTPTEKPTVTTPSTVQTAQTVSATHESNSAEEELAAPEPIQTTKTAPKAVVTEEEPVSNCHPSYSGCLEMNAGDYDCAGGTGNGPNYTGRVQVFGSDPFDLDRDGNGWGCENS